MIAKNIFFLLFIFFTFFSALGQNQATYSMNRMERRVDSVSRITDSLIASQKLLCIVFKNKNERDTTISYRRYYIDTLNGYLVKCIVDTTFEDYYKRTLRQVVIYFNQGYEFKNCYNEKKGVNADLCSFFNIYPEGGEIAPQTGKLDKGWTKELLDQKMKYYISRDIFNTKFMQKRNYN